MSRSVIYGWQEATALHLLASGVLQTSERKRALLILQAAMEASHAIGDSTTMALVQATMADAFTQLGRDNEARTLYQAALQESNTGESVFHALLGLAELAQREGQPLAALEIVAVLVRQPNLDPAPKSAAETLLHTLEAQLPPPQLAAAQARASLLDLDRLRDERLRY